MKELVPCPPCVGWIGDFCIGASIGASGSRPNARQIDGFLAPKGAVATRNALPRDDSAWLSGILIG